MVVLSRLHLVRHGRATAGWENADPALDRLGRSQAEAMADRLEPLGPMALVSSPLLRARETAAALGRRWGVEPVIEPAMTEIPSPNGFGLDDRVAWLRTAMAGRWGELDARYLAYRDGVIEALLGMASDTVVASHFIAINVAIGAATDDDRLVIRSLDNCSITEIDNSGGRLTLVSGGQEADTLIR